MKPADPYENMFMLLHGPVTHPVESLNRPAVLVFGANADFVAVAYALLLASRDQSVWIKEWAYSGCIVKVTNTAKTPTFLDPLPGHVLEKPSTTSPGFFWRRLRPSSTFELMSDGDNNNNMVEQFRDIVEPWIVASWGEGPDVPKKNPEPHLLKKYRRKRKGEGASKEELTNIDAFIETEKNHVVQQYKRALYTEGEDDDNDGSEHVDDGDEEDSTSETFSDMHE